MPAGNDKDGTVEDAGTMNVGRANADVDGEPRLQRPGRARMPALRARMTTGVSAAAVPRLAMPAGNGEDGAVGDAVAYGREQCTVRSRRCVGEREERPDAEEPGGGAEQPTRRGTGAAGLSATGT